MRVTVSPAEVTYPFGLLSCCDYSAVYSVSACWPSPSSQTSLPPSLPMPSFVILCFGVHLFSMRCMRLSRNSLSVLCPMYILGRSAWGRTLRFFLSVFRKCQKWGVHFSSGSFLVFKRQQSQDTVMPSVSSQQNVATRLFSKLELKTREELMLSDYLFNILSSKLHHNYVLFKQSLAAVITLGKLSPHRSRLANSDPALAVTLAVTSTALPMYQKPPP